MYLILISWIYIGFTSFTFGYGLLKFLESSNDRNPAVIIFLGLATQSILIAFLSIFIKISILANVIILLISLIVLVLYFKALLQYFKNMTERNTIFWLGLLCLIFISYLLILLNLSHTTTSHYDTGLYHQTYIKWIQHYAVVPGLGNIHDRLAFNSSWHLLCALYDFAFLPSLNLNDLNAFTYLIILIFSLQGVLNLSKKSKRLSDFVKALMLVPTFWTSLDFFSLNNKIYFDSPSTDLPVILIIWIVFILFLEQAEQHKKNEYLITILATFAITIKLSVLPVLLLPAFILVYHHLPQKKWMAVGRLLSLGFIILLPWIIRNVYLSGYVIFPLYQLDILNFDWQTNPEKTQYTAKIIGSWAKGVRSNFEAGFSEWFPIWHQKLDFQNLLLMHYTVILTFIFLGIFVMLLFKKARFFLNISLIPFLYLVLTCCVGIIFWFFSAPDVRFGYAFVLFYIILGFGVLFNYFLQDSPKSFAIIITLVMLSTSYHFLFDRGVKNKIYSNFLSPTVAYPNIEYTTKASKVEGIYFHSPKVGDACWDNPLHCFHPANFKNNRRCVKCKAFSLN